MLVAYTRECIDFGRFSEALPLCFSCVGYGCTFAAYAPTYHILICLIDTLVQAGILVDLSFVSCSSCYDCQAKGVFAVLAAKNVYGIRVALLKPPPQSMQWCFSFLMFKVKVFTLKASRCPSNCVQKYALDL